MKRIRAKLQHGVRIRHLDVAENELGDKGSKYLCQFLERNPHVEHIDLSANKLTVVGAVRVTRLLPSGLGGAPQADECPRLKVVRIGRNENMKEIISVCERRTPFPANESEGVFYD